MTRPLALIRPEPGWSASADAARAMKLQIVGEPLFEAEPVVWEAPGSGADALLVGSAAVFRLGGSQLSRFSRLPVHAVGETTAAAARAAGFRVERIGEGGLQTLLDECDEPLRFLRLGGEERVRLTPQAGQQVFERTVYRMRSLPIGSGFAGELERKPLIALHSAAAARHFGLELDRLGIARDQLDVLALGPRIARAAAPGWAAVHVADTPDDAALLAKATALCQ